jgi:ribosomal protein S18 acetylase RimI-like enzyme
VIDLGARLDDADVRALLAHAVGPGPNGVERACGRYRDEPAWRLFGWERDGELAGVAGLELPAPGVATLRHNAVHEALRGRGFGRAMLNDLIEQFALRTLTADTDADAVGFYRRCGFTVESLGELYPGVERFRCRWQAPDAPTCAR